MKVCSVHQCEKRAIAKSLCPMHYRRFRLYGDPLIKIEKPTACTVANCGDKVREWGLCSKHAQRAKNHGSPLITINTPPGELTRWLDEHQNYQGSDCLLWPFGKFKNGYGMISNESGSKTTAHRVMCRLAHGAPSDEALEAAHSCGVRACCNPQHLRWATHSENMADRKLHGTSLQGELHPTARLLESQVLEIFNDTNASNASLAKRYGVTPSNIQAIRRGRNWSWLTSQQRGGCLVNTQ